MSGRLTIDDVRAVAFCVRGVRRHYETMNLELPFRDFIRHGVPLEEAERVNDAHVQRAVRQAKKRIAEEDSG